MLKCRACRSSDVKSIIPLGKLPLANALLSHKKEEPDPTYNLEVMLCQACGLAQLKDLVPPEVLFSHYLYFSSNSDAMVGSARELVERLIPTLEKDPFIVEIASNDGYLLQHYVQAGLPVLGIDPAENIAKFANEKGIPTLPEFFNFALAEDLVATRRKADIIHANNVMAHVPEINDFVTGLKTLLSPRGRCVIEVPYLLDLVEKLAFDTIYHEHVYYFSVSALKSLFARQGLELFDIEKIPLHGGSLRLYAGHPGAYPVSPKVGDYIEAENNFGLNRPETYQDFMQKINVLKENLTHLLEDLNHKKMKIAAYGASAKGTTLLNYFGIGNEKIAFVVDRSPVKAGKLTPGTHLPIYAPMKLLEEGITHALLLTWNFAEEIMVQQSDFLKQGGKFIIPIPSLEVTS